MKYLRAIEPEDLDLMYIMENDPLIASYSLSSAPFSRYTLRQYIEQSKSDLFEDGQVRFTIMNPEGGEGCGFLDLTDFVPQHRRAQVGIALLPEVQGSGLATHALKEVAEYAAQQGLHQLYAFVMSTNLRARSLFLRAGYEATATLPGWFIQKNTPVDSILFQHFL